MALADIKSIHIDTYHTAASTAASEPEKWDPKTRETADHSIPFLVAVAFQEGAVTPGTFTPKGIADATKRDTMSKMTLSEDPEFTAKFPSEYNCRITVTDRSGGVHTAHTAFSKGHKNNPLADKELEGKFRICRATRSWRPSGPSTRPPTWTIYLTAWWCSLTGISLKELENREKKNARRTMISPPDVWAIRQAVRPGYGVRSRASTITVNVIPAVSFTSFTKSWLSDSNRHMHRSSPGTKVLRI